MTDEIKCFGMWTDEIHTQYMDTFTAKACGMEMVVMGILSDCQEMLHYPYAAQANNAAAKERIRQQLNVAKYILSNMMDKRDELLGSNSRKIHQVDHRGFAAA